MEEKNTCFLGIDSNLGQISKGDHVFSIDFGKSDEEEKPSFSVHEFEIKALVENNIDPEKSYFKMVDVQFPSIEIKSNLASGFFRSPEEAAREFVNSIEYIYEEAKRSLNEQFGNDTF